MARFMFKKQVKTPFCLVITLCWFKHNAVAGLAGFSVEHMGFTKSIGTLSTEQNCGYAQPGRVGHEGQAVLRRH